MTFLKILEQQRQHFRVEIEPRAVDKPAVFLDVHDDSGGACNLHYPVVYALRLVKLVLGLIIAYAGAGGACWRRPPESVQERIKKFGLEPDADWEIQVVW